MATSTTEAKQAEFESLCEQVPGLRRLYEEAQSYHKLRRKRFCATDAILVLSRRYEPMILHCDAVPAADKWQKIGIVNDVIYDVLPDCRNCGCL